MTDPTHAPPSARRDWWLWPLAVVAGALFFASLGRLWPLADVDLTVPRSTLTARAAAALAERGLASRTALARYVVAPRLDVDEAALDYVERTFGRPQAQALVRGGTSLVAYEVLYKRAGDPDALAATLHPDGAVVGWGRGAQDDADGTRPTVDEARTLARAALARWLGAALVASDTGAVVAAPIDPAMPARDPAAALARVPWHETGAASRARPARTDHTFTFERVLSARPELRERASVSVVGGRVTGARRWLVVPAAGDRAARVRRAPEQALQTVGFALLAVGAIGALAVFLLHLRDGTARLGRAAFWSGIVFACAFLTNTLADADLLASWDPLWPRWIGTLARLGWLSQATAWMFVVLFALIAAGDALDRVTGAGRGDTLWALGRGRLTDAAVGLASARGFAVGLLCGGTMAAATWLLEHTAGAWSAIQPRGFFFYALNTSVPTAATLLFFTNIALLEELGYRFFAGTWLLRATRRPWLAAALPAVVYGLTHTGLTFLPPSEPFWGRAVVMTLVGCVWGWAFLRWDALTVATSHLTADLFIFNWPRLASAHADVRLAALATVSAPLLPALVALAARALGRARGTQSSVERSPAA